MECE